ncbi:MAG: hypothetical protein ACRC80_06145 [Waterburya sp.]
MAVNQFKFFQQICLVSLLISSCSNLASINVKPTEKENKQLTLDKQGSVTDTSKESKFINDQDEPQEDILIENLVNGNYRFCSDPNPYPNDDEPDAHRYCFDFTKTGSKVTGSYLYRAPKDVPIICLEGVAQDNQVNGTGYEMIFGNSEPFTVNDFSDLQHTRSNPKLSYWDDVEMYQGGFNLKVSSPNLHSLMSPSTDKYATYSDVIRYDIAQLDLNGFEKIESAQIEAGKECVDKNIYPQVR